MKIFEKIKKYAYFFVGLTAFYFLSTFVFKQVNNVKFAQPVQQVVKERNLDPSAFFYTDALYLDTCGQESSTTHLIPDKW